MANAKSVTHTLNGFVPNKIVVKVAEGAKEVAAKGAELAEDTAAAAREAMTNSIEQGMGILETIRPAIPVARKSQTLSSVPMQEETAEEMRVGYSRLNAIADRIGKLLDGLNSKLMKPKEKVAQDAVTTKQALFEQLANTDDLAKREEIFGELHRLTDMEDAAKTTTPDEIEITDADILDSTPVTTYSNPFKTEADEAAAGATFMEDLPEVKLDDLVLPTTLQKRISAMKSNFETLKQAEGITHTPARKSLFSEDLSATIQTEDNARIAQEWTAFKNQETFNEAIKKIETVVANSTENIDSGLQPRPFIGDLNDRTETMVMKFDDEIAKNKAQVLTSSEPAKPAVRLVSSNANPTPIPEDGNTQKQWFKGGVLAWMRRESSKDTTQVGRKQAVNS